MLALHVQGGPAQVMEAVRRDGSRHERMTIPVAANPGAKTQPGKGRRIGQQLGIETRFTPSMAQAVVQAVKNVREDILQVVVGTAPLTGDVGLRQTDFAGAPQTLDGGSQFGADVLLLGRGPHGVFTTDHHQVDLAMLFQHRRPLGFRRVGGEHRFDPDTRQEAGDGRAIDTRSRQFLQVAAPQTSLGQQALLGLADATALIGGVLLDHVEELKGHREGLDAPVTEIGPVIGGLGAGPRQSFGQVLIALLGKDLLEAAHHVGEVAVGFFEHQIVGRSHDGRNPRFSSGVGKGCIIHRLAVCAALGWYA